MDIYSTRERIRKENNWIWVIVAMAGILIGMLFWFRNKNSEKPTAGAQSEKQLKSQILYIIY